MNRTEAFQILEIECTRDERAIKNAYRERLAVTNPEDNPEGFKELRAAYEEACRYAGEEESGREEARDTSPSGLWVEKAAEVYGNIHTRQDTEAWNRLFEEDVFLSLEEEENCRLKLLRFLMEHFKLPTSVWKLLDRKLSIRKDAAALREKFPADYLRYILSKCEHGEDIDFTQFEGDENADYDLFLRYYDKCCQALQEDKAEEAEQYLKRADELGIRHPLMEIYRASLLCRQGRPDEAQELLERQMEKYPGDLVLVYSMAEMQWKRRAEDERFGERAAEFYKKLKKENDGHYMANFRLTEWYCDKGQYHEAKKCAEKILAAGGGNDYFMEVFGRVNARIEKELEAKYREGGGWEPALELCWCYLQDKKISRGIRLALKIERQLPAEKQTEYSGLMAKLYVEQAEYEDSIIMTHAWQEELEKKLASQEEYEEREKDRDRCLQARLIRFQCYHNLGFRDKENFGLAIEEGKQVLTGTTKDIGILMEMAQIYTEMGEYELALELVERLLNEYQFQVAHTLSLEVYRRMLSAGGVVQAGQQCIRFFPGFQKAYEYMARVYLDLERREDLEKVLEDAEKNGVKSVILDAYRFRLDHRHMDPDELNRKLIRFRSQFRGQLECGKEEYYTQGLPILTEYLYHYPDSYMLVERGIFHRVGRHYKEAKEDFEKAIAISPDNAYALNGLSFVYKYMGDYENALFYIKKAILYNAGEDLQPKIYSDMGNLYALLGDFEMALAVYRQYEQLLQHKDEQYRSRVTWYLENMAEFHAQLGNVEKAAQLYKTIMERQKANLAGKEIAPEDYYESPESFYDNLANLYMRSGMEDRAREILNLWDRTLRISLSDHIWELRIKKYGRRVFFQCRGWFELIFGQPAEAVKAFGRMVMYMRRAEERGEEGKLCDAVFAAILCGNKTRGKKYAAKLQIWRNRQTFQNGNNYFNRPKAFLQIEFLTKYFTESDEKLQELLDRGESCEICHFCTNPVCKELEGVRVLLLLRQGRREEAAERVKKNLEIQPWDEYMLAIRHTAFHDSL